MKAQTRTLPWEGGGWKDRTAKEGKSNTTLKLQTSRCWGEFIITEIRTEKQEQSHFIG